MTSTTISKRMSSGDIFIIDSTTPVGVELSGKYKRSFAYYTLKERLPVILTQIIDTMSRNKDQIQEKYGKDAGEEIKQICGAISKLKNELVTNKCLLPLSEISDKDKDKEKDINKKISKKKLRDDVPIWNKQIEKLSEGQNEGLRWYNSVWLICECYMYRRIAQEIALMTHLKTLDPFETQKVRSFQQIEEAINNLSQYVMTLTNTKSIPTGDLKKNLINLLKINLWGNKCDLSFTMGEPNKLTNDLLLAVESLNKDILVDNSIEISELLCKYAHEQSVLDIVLDNAGYELFTDLCLAVFLSKTQLVHKIRFYVKRYPWFVSDATVKDFYWMIEQLLHSQNDSTKAFGKYCEESLQSGSWTVEEESFWTEPFNFCEMKDEDPCLYTKLSEAHLVIFKGDLNYRKLLGDMNCKYSTSFEKALRGFKPTNLLSLRTLKSDLCAGLTEGMVEKLSEEYPDWMIMGKFGLIQASIRN